MLPAISNEEMPLPEKGCPDSLRSFPLLEMQNRWPELEPPLSMWTQKLWDARGKHGRGK